MSQYTYLNRAIIFAFMIVTLDMIGVSLIMPALPFLLEEITGLGAKQTADISGYLQSSYAVMQFLFGATLGSLSDRFGRKPVILFAMGMFVLDYIIMASATSLWLLFLGRILAGLSGASASVAFSIAADASTTKDKAKAMGLVSAGFGLGFMIGPALGGIIIAFFGIRAPFIFAALVSLLAFFMVLVFFKETLPKKRAFSLRKSNPLAAIKSIVKMRSLSTFFLIYIFLEIAGTTYPSIWSYYVIAKFGWTELLIGYSLMLAGALSFFVSAGLIGPVQNRLGERRTISLGLFFTAFAFFGFSFIENPLWLWLLLIPCALGDLAYAPLQGLLSNATAEDRQGELQGSLAMLSALALIITPIGATQLFHFTTSSQLTFSFAGAPMLAAALLVTLSLVLFLRKTRDLKTKAKAP